MIKNIYVALNWNETKRAHLQNVLLPALQTITWLTSATMSKTSFVLVGGWMKGGVEGGVDGKVDGGVDGRVDGKVDGGRGGWKGR